MTKSTIFIFIVSILTGIAPLRAQNFLYAKGLANSLPRGGNVRGECIKTDLSGGTYVAGYFSGTADFDPGPGEATLVAKNRQLFLARYDSSGKYLFARAVGGTQDMSTAYIALDRLNNVYMTGTFSGTVDVDPGPGVAAFTSASGNTDVFIARYDSTGKYMGATRAGNVQTTNRVYNITVDNSANIYICGAFRLAVDSVPGSGNTSQVSAVVAKYDSSFHYISSIAGDASSFGPTQAANITVDSLANVYITGQGYPIRLQYSVYVAKYNAAGTKLFASSKISAIATYGQGIAADNAGNVYISGAYNDHIYLAKYNLNGTELFSKSIGGAGTGYSLELDGMGHLYMTGGFTYTVDFDPGPGTADLTSAGGYDIFVACYDTAGNYLLAYAQGGKGNDLGTSISTGRTGDLFVTGTFSGRADFNPGTDTAALTVDASISNAFICRTSKEGLYRWAGQLGNYSNAALVDRGRSIAVDAQGNTYITGLFAGTVDFDPGSGVANLTSNGLSDAFFAKYDHQGNYIFAKAIGSSRSEEGTGIALDGAGFIYIIGSFQGKADFDPGADSVFLVNTGTIDLFLAKYSETGDYIYAKSVNGVNSSYIQGYDIAVDKAGNAFICGAFSGYFDFDPGPGTVTLASRYPSQDIFFARYNAQGDYVFAKSMGGGSVDYGLDVAIDSADNIYVTGYFYGIAYFDPDNNAVVLSGAESSSDIFLAKYDQAGKYIYAKRIGGTGADVGTGIVVDGSGNVLVSGSFESTVDFDPDPTGVAMLTARNREDIFFAKYDSQGRYVYAKSIGGAEIDNLAHITLDGSGNIYLTGSFQGTADFDPGSGIVSLYSAGAEDVFVAKYDNNGNYVYAKPIGSTATDLSYGIAADGGGNVFITGSTAGAANFNRGGDSTNSVISSLNSEDIFFAKYGPSAALPVTLTAFKAEKLNNGTQVKVYWTVTAQPNNSYFDVERSSNGVQFNPIGRVQGCAACTGLQTYQHYDSQPLNGLSYYRLKQVDLDGKVFYSLIVTINRAAGSKIAAEIFPGTGTGMFKISVHNNTVKRQVDLLLMNSDGRLVKQERVWIPEGDYKVDYNMTSQASGMYYLGITDSKGTPLAMLKVINK